MNHYLTWQARKFQPFESMCPLLIMVIFHWHVNLQTVVPPFLLSVFVFVAAAPSYPTMYKCSLMRRPAPRTTRTLPPMPKARWWWTRGHIGPPKKTSITKPLPQKKRKKIDPQIALSRPRLHGDQVDLQGRPGKLLSVTTVVVNGLIRSLQRLNRNQLDYQVVLLLSFEEYIYWPATILDSRNKSFAAVPLDPTFPSPQRNRVQWPPATTCVHMERQWKHTRVSLIGLQSCLYHLLEGKGNIAKQVYMISLIQIGQQLKGLP